MQDSIQYSLGQIDEHLISIDRRLDNLERRNGGLSGKTWAMVLASIGVITTAVTTGLPAILAALR